MIHNTMYLHSIILQYYFISGPRAAPHPPEKTLKGFLDPKFSAGALWPNKGSRQSYKCESLSRARARGRQRLLRHSCMITGVSKAAIHTEASFHLSQRDNATLAASFATLSLNSITILL